MSPAYQHVLQSVGQTVAFMAEHQCLCIKKTFRFLKHVFFSNWPFWMGSVKEMTLSYFLEMDLPKELFVLDQRFWVLKFGFLRPVVWIFELFKMEEMYLSLSGETFYKIYTWTWKDELDCSNREIVKTNCGKLENKVLMDGMGIVHGDKWMIINGVLSFGLKLLAGKVDWKRWKCNVHTTDKVTDAVIWVLFRLWRSKGCLKEFHLEPCIQTKGFSLHLVKLKLYFFNFWRIASTLWRDLDKPVFLGPAGTATNDGSHPWHWGDSNHCWTMWFVILLQISDVKLFMWKGNFLKYQQNGDC